MVTKKSRISGGRWGTKFDAELNTNSCDRYNNAELTIVSKICLQAGNPSGGSYRGKTLDSDGDEREVLRWSPAAWRDWKSRFVQVCRRSGHGRFWLINNQQWNQFDDGGVSYYPNIWCRLKIVLTEAPASAYHSIVVYRVSKKDRAFRSDYKLMDQYDNWRQRYHEDSQGKWTHQRTSVHEFFHTLGVRHVDHGKAHCPANSAGNASACYGKEDEDRHSLMGAGMNLQPAFAEPWRRAMISITSKGSLAATNDWRAELKRHFPRTAEEARRRIAVTTRPRRG